MDRKWEPFFNNAYEYRDTRDPSQFDRVFYRDALADAMRKYDDVHYTGDMLHKWADDLYESHGFPDTWITGYTVTFKYSFQLMVAAIIAAVHTELYYRSKS